MHIVTVEFYNCILREAIPQSASCCAEIQIQIQIHRQAGLTSVRLTADLHPALMFFLFLATLTGNEQSHVCAFLIVYLFCCVVQVIEEIEEMMQESPDPEDDDSPSQSDLSMLSQDLHTMKRSSTNTSYDDSECDSGCVHLPSKAVVIQTLSMCNVPLPCLLFFFVLHSAAFWQ